MMGESVVFDGVYHGASHVAHQSSGIGQQLDCAAEYKSCKLLKEK